MGESNWDMYWQHFLQREKLINVVQELDQIDKECKTETICRGVYEAYEDEHKRLDTVRKSFLECLDDIAHVHLSTSRVKSIDSILRKIIVKRHMAIASVSDPYRDISADKYQNILTDLVGIRIILSYRGNWIEIHDKLLEKFPLRAEEAYKVQELLPHDGTEPFQAEWPKVYYAEDDDIGCFKERQIKPKLHEKGYRSLHYTVSYQNTYIELQVRTIYDEAWSDVDHRYVYKQEANPSNQALEELSRLLCKLTNLSNDIGEQMKVIFDGEKVVSCADDSKWLISDQCKEFFTVSLSRMGNIYDVFEDMCAKMGIEIENRDE